MRKSENKDCLAKLCSVIIFLFLMTAQRISKKNYLTFNKFHIQIEKS